MNREQQIIIQLHCPLCHYLQKINSGCINCIRINSKLVNLIKKENTPISFKITRIMMILALAFVNSNTQIQFHKLLEINNTKESKHLKNKENFKIKDHSQQQITMDLQEEKTLDLNYQKLIFKCSEKEILIETKMRSQKFHQALDLLLNVSKEQEISFIGKQLEELSHLSGLIISFFQTSLCSESSLKSIFNSLRQFSSLKQLKLDFKRQQKNQFNFEQMVVQLSESISSLPQLESLSLSTFNYSCFNIQGQRVLTEAITNLLHLKDLDLCLILANEHMQSLNELLSQINKLTKLQRLSIMIVEFGSKIIQKRLSLNWNFENLSNLENLCIKISLNQITEVSTLCTHLSYLKRLKKLQIKFQDYEFDDQFNSLFNTIFKLESLEELYFGGNLNFGNYPILIGQEVYQSSQIRTLQLHIFNQKANDNTGYINLCEQLCNIEHLEQLSLIFQSSFLSMQSYEVLANWINKWDKIKQFTFTTFNTSINYDYKQLFLLFQTKFQALSSLTKLELILTTKSQISSSTELILGLSQLSSLTSLRFQNLYEESIMNIEQEYANLFKQLPNLIKLEIDRITNKKEITCLGRSFQFLKQLTHFQIQLYCISNFAKELEVFSKNLILLTNLKEFHFILDCTLRMNDEQMSGEEIEFLLGGVQKLNPLKSLFLKLQNKEESNRDIPRRIQKNNQNSSQSNTPKD